MCCCCRRADGSRREVWADRAEVSRGRSTGRGRVRVGKDRTSRWAEELMLLALVAVIAAIPRNVGPSWEGSVHSGEYHGGA